MKHTVATRAYLLVALQWTLIDAELYATAGDRTSAVRSASRAGGVRCNRAQCEARGVSGAWREAQTTRGKSSGWGALGTRRRAREARRQAGPSHSVRRMLGREHYQNDKPNLFFSAVQ